MRGFKLDESVQARWEELSPKVEFKPDEPETPSQIKREGGLKPDGKIYARWRFYVR